MINFTKEELDFLKNIGINPENLKTRWQWVNEKTAIAFYRDIIYPHFNRVPNRDEIDNIGYRGFRNALKRIDKTLSDIIKKLGFTPNFEYKYVGMDFQDLVNFFINKIYPDLKERLPLEEDKPPTRSQVALNGYRGFTYNLDKLKKRYGDLLKEAGFEPLKEYKYKGKSFQDLIKMFKTQIYPDLIKRKIIKVGTVPTENDMRSNGYSGFIKAIRRKSKTWTGLLRAAGFKPKYERLYDNKTYKQLISLFKNTIYPNITEIYSLEENEAPLYDHIEKHYRGFLQGLSRVRKKYSELLLDAGFEQKYGKYNDIRNFKDLVEAFKEQVYPDVLERSKELNIILEEQEPPTAKMLRDLGYNNFLNKVYDICSYNELVKALGFQPNIEYKYKDKSYKDLIDLFIYEIYAEIKIKFALKENEAPNTDELGEFGYGGFIDALRRNGKTYTELVSDSNLEPRQKAERLVGIRIHPILELLFMKFTRQYKCHSYFEISPNLISLKRVDNSVFRESNFKNFIESRQSIIQLPEIIKIINIDYTIGSRPRTFKIKLDKGYQGKEKFLIIVYLGTSRKQIQIPDEVPYRKHVIVLNHYEFAQFMGYSGEILAEYNRIIKLAHNALFIPNALNELKELAKNAKNKLKKYSNQQEEFEFYIKSEGLNSLLNETLSDINLDRWINEKAENKIQKKGDLKGNQKSILPKFISNAFNSFKKYIPANLSGLDEEIEELIDENLFISEKVKEDNKSKVDSLVAKRMERVDRKTDFLNITPIDRYSNRADLEPISDKNKSLENFNEVYIKTSEIPFKLPITQLNEHSFDVPGEQPIDHPIIQPSESPIEVPGEQPIDQPMIQPNKQPIEVPDEQPIDQPIIQPNESPIDVPSEQPINQPIIQPNEPPIDIPVEQPIDQPIIQPNESPIEVPIEKSIDQPIIQPNESPIDIPVEQPIDQPIASSDLQSSEQTLEQTIEQQNEKPVKEHISAYESGYYISFEDNPKFNSENEYLGEENLTPNGKMENTSEYSKEDSLEEKIDNSIEIIDVNDLELITDPEVLDDYDHNEHIENLKEDYSEDTEQELDNIIDVGDLELITDPEVLEDYDHNEHIENLKEDYSEEPNQGLDNIIDTGDLELITDPEVLDDFDHNEHRELTETEIPELDNQDVPVQETIENSVDTPKEENINEPIKEPPIESSNEPNYESNDTSEEIFLEDSSITDVNALESINDCNDIDCLKDLVENEDDNNFVIEDGVDNNEDFQHQNFEETDFEELSGEDYDVP